MSKTPRALLLTAAAALAVLAPAAPATAAGGSTAIAPYVADQSDYAAITPSTPDHARPAQHWTVQTYVAGKLTAPDRDGVVLATCGQRYRVVLTLDRGAPAFARVPDSNSPLVTTKVNAPRTVVTYAGQAQSFQCTP